LYTVPASEKTVQARNRSWGNYYPFKIDTPAKQAAERSEFRDIAVKESVREMRGMRIIKEKKSGQRK